MSIQKISLVIERYLLAAGVLLLAFWTLAILHGRMSASMALSDFETHAQTRIERTTTEGEVDFSMWAQKRIEAYKNSLLTMEKPALAVLEISKVHIRVPVFEGTDDLTLNRGVGHIHGTASLGTEGNVGIAGHRDGFFRGLKDVSLGDEIELNMTAGKATYTVDQIEIVEPSNLQVLQPRRAPSITLVTCFPFYFVGDAPKRFIVHASLSPREHIAKSDSQPNFTSQVNESKERQNEK